MISDKINEAIQSMLNKPYGVGLQGQSKKFICWKFCREIYSLLGLQLPHGHSQKELVRISKPVVPCIVLFCMGNRWHSGVVWPDGLHFIHASTKNIFDPNEIDYIARKDRLTGWPNRLFIEGYYAA